MGIDMALQNQSMKKSEICVTRTWTVSYFV